MKVDLHDRLEAVGAAAWDDLLDRVAFRSPFLWWTWQQQWVRVFAQGRRLEVRSVVDRAGKLVALLPLYEAEPEVFRLVGGVDVSDYLDLIVETGRAEEAWAALLAAPGISPSVWDLHAVPAASPTVTMLPRIVTASERAAMVTVEARCPVLTLPASWEQYVASLSGKHRHELTRKMRRLGREAPDARATSLGARREVEARFDDFLRLHRRSRAGKAKFMDERMERFFRGIVSSLAERGALRLWFLDTASEPLASFITLEWDGTVGLYNSGFEPSRAALAPGLVLLAHMIGDAIARGKTRFDFLRGEERYKYEFEPTPEDVCQVRIT
ncbi:MAG: GNAT family N-acetyltransferase [Candidatus Rokuibacteriota bacterium]